MTIARKGASYYLVVSSDRVDWAQIFMTEGKRDDGGRWGVISFVSTFGNRGHSFTSISDRPFPLWLTGCDWDYLANKFWGLEARVFDFDASTKELRRRICEKRRGDYMTKWDASECWAEIAGLEQVRDASAFSWQLMGNCPDLMKHAGVYDETPTMTCNNPQCDGFRDSIWKPFCAWVLEHREEFA